MKICMLSSGHRANDDRIFYKEARSLAKVYDEVYIICPNISTPPDDLKIKFKTFEKGNGIFGRFKTMNRLLQVARSCKADLFHCHEPESLWVAVQLKREMKAKVIFDSHEMYSASLEGRFYKPLGKIVALFYRQIEKSLIRKCDGSIAASWAIGGYLKSILVPQNTEVILNAPVVEVFGEHGEREWGETTIVCHDGHLGFDRGLVTMVKAVHIVSKKHRVVFKIVGDVFGKEREWLERYIGEYGLERVIIRTGWLDYKDVGKELGPCHIGLIALQNVPNNVVTSSNKVFNYMLYGIPFIGPEFRLAKIKLVQEDQCGLLADSSSPESYASAISYMIQHRDETIRMGLNAKRASMEKYRWEHMERKLLAFYRQILGC